MRPAWHTPPTQTSREALAWIDLGVRPVAGRSYRIQSANPVAGPRLFDQSLFHHTRFLIQLTVGTMPHKKVMRAIELLGIAIAPAARREL